MPAVTPRGGRRPRPLVLLVDHDADLRAVVDELLVSELGVRVLEAADGTTRVGGAGRPPPAVVVAAPPPGTNGHDALSCLRADPVTADVPLVWYGACRPPAGAAPTVRVQKTAPTERLLEAVRRLLPEPD